MAARNLALTRQAEQSFQKVEKISSEVFLQTLYAFVASIGCVPGVDVDKELFKVGRRLGLRLCDELLAKFASGLAITNFIEACDVVVKIGLKVYLGVSAETSTDSSNSYRFKLLLPPKFDFDDILSSTPEPAIAQLLAGVISGTLAQLSYVARCQFEVADEFATYTVELEQRADS